MTSKFWCILLAGTLASAACYRLPPPTPRLHELPAKLSQTGLYAQASIAPGVRPYRPSYALWSDGAEKKRWILLPGREPIDISDMDNWQLPVGTKIWKEFTRDGVRVETRLLQRVSGASDGWAAAAYVWNREQSEATRTDDGLENALGTSHDVPSARACPACHAGRPSFALGFSAIQLSHPAQEAHELTLTQLNVEGLLSTGATDFALPGDEETRAALGYLHTNCGSCHNSGRPETARAMRPPRQLDLWLTVSSLKTVEETTIYRSARWRFLSPSEPAASNLLERMESAGLVRRRMPPIASEVPDRAGMEHIARWIGNLR